MSISPDLPKNPLIRDGVSQRQRQVLALSPDYVKVDDRNLADFLVFAHNLSQQVNYYDANNVKDGNWLDFFASSTPVQIALMSKTQPEKVKDKYTQALQAFIRNQSAVNLKSIVELWKTDLLQPIANWYQELEAYTPLKAIIQGLVKTNLPEPLRRMQSFEQMSGEVKTEVYEQFVDLFKLDLSADATGDGLRPTVGERSRVNTTSEPRAEIDAVFQMLFQTYRQIIQEAPQYLQASLTARQDHPPHLALYFAFWEVLQPARDDLNRMTQRHLDFFYRQVLRLRDRPAQADHAHLIFELAKTQPEYKLQAATRFSAGKDASGVELFYQLDAETVFHQAQIASLQGLFLNSQEITTGDIPTNLLGLYASPIANSFDGVGGDFPKEQVLKTWLPFGDRTRNHAVLGLAIASDIFYLQEGTRTLIFTLTFDQVINGVTVSDLADIFTVDFSGQKDWVLGTNSATSLEGATLKLVVTLTAEQEPIGVYHRGLPGAALTTNLPVARLQLKDQARVNGLSAYSYLRDLKLNQLTISTQEIEIRDLLLQNDLSPINPGKPFTPFGPRPEVGTAFYIGSKEVFQKNLSLLKLKVEWQGLPANLENHYRGYYADGEKNKPNFNNFSAKVERLTQHTWSAESLPDNYNLFYPLGDCILLDRTNSTPLPGDEIPELTNFNLQTDNGFLRFVLKQNFLHDEFPRKYALQTLASAKNFAAGEYVNGAVYEVFDELKKTITLKRNQLGETLSNNPKNVAPVTLNEPYTPVIQSIALSYIAVAQQKDCQLFHLYPFDRFAELVSQDTPQFLPQFSNEGELLIGIKELDPPTSLHLLFQVAEETADTSVEKIALQWHYLRDNTWISLSDRIVSDTTDGLITSGIVNLGIPGDISKEKTTILDPNLYWIKASVPQRSGAICQILGVYTQAARVTFIDAGNDPNHLAAPLKAGSIAKLAIPTPEIKKVEQPYDSFGGQIKEQPEHFYTRISEHLRHKGRAVTIFDYERLVLEKFPQIYKVRCINHGQVGQGRQFYELIPGAVTLVVIPDLSQRSSTNDLEPKVNINLLEKIEQYLASLSSSWVDIRAVNPLYEHIQVECEVKFKSPYDGNFGYYRRDLQQAITQFLTPWTVDQGAEIHLGGTIYRSAIINFIEQQYYVDYVVNFQMHHDNQRNVKEAIASTARSVLTSVSAETTGQIHIIQEANTVADNPQLAAGILGYESLDGLELGE